MPTTLGISIGPFRDNEFMEVSDEDTECMIFNFKAEKVTSVFLGAGAE